MVKLLPKETMFQGDAEINVWRCDDKRTEHEFKTNADSDGTYWFNASASPPSLIRL